MMQIFMKNNKNNGITTIQLTINDKVYYINYMNTKLCICITPLYCKNI